MGGCGLGTDVVTAAPGTEGASSIGGMLVPVLITAGVALLIAVIAISVYKRKNKKEKPEGEKPWKKQR